MSKKPEPERITLTFDLHDLPTAQHRAGLAGLILQIDSMGPDGNRRDPRRIPDVEDPTATSATIAFTRESMQGVFDDLYDAETVETTVTTKWVGAAPKRETTVEQKDPKTGALKTVRAFVYDVVQPLAHCLHRYIQPDARAWLNLWRQMIWEIPRGGNNVRLCAPFNERASDKDKPCSEGSKAWIQINKFLEKRAKSQFETDQISGALFLGAQAVNAEGVPFSGRVNHNLLLHFWQVVVLAFVPRAIDKKDGKIKRLGYVLAIPDVADLTEFRREFPRMLGSLSADPSRRLPDAAQVDLPEQANLAVLLRMRGGGDRERNAKAASRALRRGGAGALRGKAHALAADKNPTELASGGVHAVESFHMAKAGNNIKMLSFARVVDRPGLIEDFGRIDRSYRSPLFRAARMRALIEGRPWHSGMIELFAEYPWPFFIEGDDTPKYLARFGRDANDQLRAFFKSTYDMKLEDMDDKERVEHLSLIVKNLVDRYVDGRAEAKTGLKVESFEKKPVPGKEGRTYTDYPKDFREAQQRVCSDAFLSMRSRHDQDFIDFFAGSICSVAQFLPADQYRFLIQTLMTKSDANPLARKVLSWEDVKAMAMIAVSACSYRVRPRETQTQRSPS